MGGVLLNIDYNKTRDAFIKLGVTNFDDYYSQTYADPLFAQLERGLVEREEFYKLFQQQSGEPLSNTDIDTAWNAMLGTFKDSSLAYVETLKQDYTIYLLSNTNVIHYDALLNIHTQQYGNNRFDDRFHKTYFSHHMHQRKPDAAAFRVMLEENNLRPAKTLFVDDTFKNIVTAQALGIHTIYLQSEKAVEEVLKEKLKTF